MVHHFPHEMPEIVERQAIRKESHATDIFSDFNEPFTSPHEQKFISS
jgi:hypothetical protein